MINLVISRSQQKGNRCVMGDTEQEHTGLIVDAVCEILKNDRRLNLYNIPKLSGNDSDNLVELVRLSNKFISDNGGTGYHLSVHTDGGYDGRGASGFYYSERGAKFGRPIFDEVCAITPWPDMTFRQRTGLYELKNTNAVAFLLEVSFHDKPDQAKWIHDNVSLIAQAIVKGIYKGLGIEPLQTEIDWKAKYTALREGIEKLLKEV